MKKSTVGSEIFDKLTIVSLMMGKFGIGNCEKIEREAGEAGEKINHRVNE